MSVRAGSAWQAFLDTPLDDVLSRAEDPALAEEEVLALFHRTAADVPAYAAYLRERGIDPASIRSMSDFRSLPLLTRADYLKRYPLPALCRHGRLEACDMIAVSSGSTGQPTFWPRFLSDELPITRRFEQVFLDSFQVDQRRTLAVVCFALGTWVGGMYTAASCRYLAARGYPVTSITPGNNKAEILRVIGDLGPLFDQVVLLGYPPFLKDVVDTGRAAGIDWPSYRVKLVMAGEVFSEEWRTLMGERLGSSDACFDSASLYGTADAGVLANETPLSIRIRRFLAANPDVAHALFGEFRLPTLAQYDPTSRFFEVQDGTLLFSGDNGIPLIRYHIADSGGIVLFQDMLDFLAGHGFDPLLDSQRVRRLPFVYVFGRADFTISYFGANVFPENVTVGLEEAPINAWVTGKFVLQAREDVDRNRYLSVVVELAPGVEPSAEMPGVIADAILRHLMRLNSEFANYVPAEHRRPRVELAPTGDPEYFPVGVKHRYTRR
jgi:phenylacetate-CoA ligase